MQLEMPDLSNAGGATTLLTVVVVLGWFIVQTMTSITSYVSAKRAAQKTEPAPEPAGGVMGGVGWPDTFLGGPMSELRTNVGHCLTTLRAMEHRLRDLDDKIEVLIRRRGR